MSQLFQHITGNIPTQSFLSDTCFERTSANTTKEALARMRAEGKRAFGVAAIDVLANYGERNDTCEWLASNTWVEPSLYDHDIPPTHVLPMHISDNDLPWNMLTWCYDPYASTPHRVLSNANKIVQLYQEKSERYLTKSVCYDHLEVCWLCYNRVGNVFFIHHLQVRGSIRDSLTANEQTWMYRYMLRMFAEMVPPSSILVAPDAFTLTAYVDKHPELIRIPTIPFSRHVFGKSRFKRTMDIPSADLKDSLYFTTELEASQQRYWIRYI